jgi:hypothetical protein
LAEEKIKKIPENQTSWHPAKPEKIPAFTFWPIVLAVGIVFVFWGLITSLIISGVGLVFMAIALLGWIQEFSND